VPTRIQRKDGKPMGIAGLWGSNRKATGEEVFSFTMLTINADDHDFFKNFHKSQDEKRMVVILREDQYDGWLEAPTARVIGVRFQLIYPGSSTTFGRAPGCSLSLRQSKVSSDFWCGAQFSTR
jgi:putative SOS response-associated peptidase YedK